MKTLIYIILVIATVFVSGCYSSKSMDDSKKADKYLIVY